MPPSKVIRTSGTNLGPGAKLTVDFIDTGQGNAVLVTYPNGNFMLVDCGSQTTSTKGWPFTHVQSYITSVTGGSAISCVVLSHGDDDHTAFVPYISEAARPTYVHYGGPISDYSEDVKAWIKKQEKQKDQFVYRYKQDYCMPQPDADFASETTSGEAWAMVLSAGYGKSPNSKSIVLLIRFGRHAVVLPGDADTTTEAFILSKVPKKLLAGCTVLMPGHHGAAESTGRPWAKALDPDIDVISASGTNMAYAHPNCAKIELLEKYCLAGAERHDVTCSAGKGSPYKVCATVESVLTTATNGDVRFISDGTNWRLLASSTSADELAQEQPHPLLRSMVAHAPWNRRPAVQYPAVRLGPDPGLGPLAEPAVSRRTREPERRRQLLTGAPGGWPRE
ncbi:ComEC/Rec2 family competence protein [Streptomyces sp. NBC_00829]|uniref:ComEC/Rec2 family competence protein n=1 Tax=Streptomyces sp. NBC_00829 TaxID=2903679 RepID=UPI00386603D5|nr:MBL fold metallo-hydrolase [Streptomyces sp. NBC_00829]